VRARIHVTSGAAIGRVLELEGPQSVVVGRGADAHLCVAADTALSRNHVRLELAPPRFTARDLESRHGTFVNGRRQTEAELRDGDQIQVGETVLRVELLHDEVAPTMPAPQPTARGWSSPAHGRLIAVRCRCGAIAAHEPARAGEDDVVYLCESCQERFAIAPVLPPGYQMIRTLGRGAMGCVYLARHEGDGVDRAIKQILPKAAMSAQMRAMFLREAAVQAKLDHPNIVRVYELAEPTPGSFSIVMEYVEGQSADMLIKGGRTVEPALVVDIACQALAGLAYAHARQIVHRDIKEANLMLIGNAGDKLVVKVADFGLAKNFQEAGASGMTNDGALGGTLPYMPKEQLLDFKYVKPPADIYALGATMYRLLTGCFPRDYREGENWVLMSLEQPIVPLRQREAGRALPAALCKVIEQALEPDVKQRFQTAEAMRRALEALHL